MHLRTQFGKYAAMKQIGNLNIGGFPSYTAVNRVQGRCSAFTK